MRRHWQRLTFIDVGAAAGGVLLSGSGRGSMQIGAGGIGTAEWELRFGSRNRFRVFSPIDPENREVRIVAVGVKRSEFVLLQEVFKAPTIEELGLDRLSAEDRLAVAEAIWDSVARETAAAPLSAAQRAELERRLSEARQEYPAQCRKLRHLLLFVFRRVT